jgi:hypothetical protein
VNTKSVMYVFISTFLVAAIYSSTATHYLSAANTQTYLGHACFKYTSGPANVQSCCWVQTDNTGLKILSDSCVTGICGPKNNLCPDPNTIPSVLPEKIRNLLEENNKDTKDSNTDVLKDNGILEGDNNTSDGNVKEPKAQKLPEDLGSLVHEGR